MPGAKGEDNSEDAAEDSLKRAQYELLELVKQQGGLQIDADTGSSSSLDTSSKITLVIFSHTSCHICI